MTRVGAFVLILALAGCGGGAPGFLDRVMPRGGADAGDADAAAEAGEEAEADAGEPLTAPMREEAAAPPPAEATTAEEFDTTTEEQRVAAAEPPAEGGQLLGTTVASLGELSQPGFWLETPLVSQVTQGRLVYPANGKSVQVELRPSGGAAGSGSRISLGAMRVLEADLSSLPELTVYSL